MGVVCWQVEISASGWLLVRRSPTECGVSECDRGASIMRRSWPTGDCRAIKKSSQWKQQYQGVRIILGHLEWRNILLSPLSTNVFSQSVRLICYSFFPQPINFYDHISNWSLLSHSPLTVSVILPTQTDTQMGMRIRWPFTCSCAVSSVFWRHHFMCALLSRNI